MSLLETDIGVCVLFLGTIIIASGVLTWLLSGSSILYSARVGISFIKKVQTYKLLLL